MPFGVLDFNDEKFVEIVEKPEYKHYINSGINVFSKEALSNLDNFEKKIDLPEFINEFKNKEQIKKYEIKITGLMWEPRKFKSY